MPLIVDDAIAVADALGFDRFHLVGHDWGAIIGWQVAGKYQDRVRSYTSVSVPHPKAFRGAISADQEQKSKSQYMRFFQEEGTPDVLLADDAAGLRVMYAELPAEAAGVYLDVLCDRAALAGALNYYRTMDGTLASGIGPITMPAMLVWGDQDMVVGRSGVEATAAQIEAPFRLEVLEGAGHWIPELEAGTLNDLLLDHIGKAAAGS